MISFKEKTNSQFALQRGGIEAGFEAYCDKAGEYVTNLKEYKYNLYSTDTACPKIDLDTLSAWRLSLEVVTTRSRAM